MITVGDMAIICLSYSLYMIDLWTTHDKTISVEHVPWYISINSIYCNTRDSVKFFL